MGIITNYNIKFKDTGAKFKELMGSYDVNIVVSDDGRIFRELTPSSNASGYKTVEFKRSDNTRKRMLVHRIMGYAFIDEFNDIMEVNHIDGNKSNNSVCNLEMTTTKENALHARNNFLNLPSIGGVYNKQSKPVICMKDGNVIGIFPSQGIASEFMNIDKGDIGKVCKGQKDSLNGFTFEYLKKDM